MAYRHKDIIASIYKFCSDFIEECRLLELSDNMTFFNYDAHAEETDIPNNDLFGSANITYNTDGDMLDLNFGLGVSTMDDPNHFRLHDIIDLLMQKVDPNEGVVPLIDSTTGEEIMLMKVAGQVTLLPVGRTEIRDLQMVAIQLLPAKVLRTP